MKPAQAQENQGNSFLFTMGYTRAERSGLGMSLGAWYQVEAFSISGRADVTLVPTNEVNERYRRETFDNGTTVCRDLSNGQFAESERCGGALDTLLALMFEIGVTPLPTLPLYVGFGSRLGDTQVPYAALQYNFSNDSPFVWFVRATGGPSFFQAHLGGALF